MRARAAYISSFGTTGILVAAALLMLAMVSALVAFHAWPGVAPGDSVSSVPLAQRPQATLKLDVVRKVSTPLKRSRSRPSAPARHLSTRGLVKVPAGARAVMVAFVKVPRGRSAPGAVMTPANGHIAPPAAGGSLPADPQLPGSPATGQVQQIVDGAVGQIPPPPGSENGASVTLPTLQGGQPSSVGISFGSTSVSVPLP